MKGSFRVGLSICSSSPVTDNLSSPLAGFVLASRFIFISNMWSCCKFCQNRHQVRRVLWRIFIKGRDAMKTQFVLDTREYT